MNKKRVLCFLLTVLMVFGMVPAKSSAVNSNGEERVPMDYVLVVDVSDTMDYAAPEKVCASACDLFMDLLPYRNVRVGVIAYGYTGSKDDRYPYSGDFKVTFEDEYVHLIADMQESSTAMSRTDIMDKLVNAYKQKGSKSTHGQALMAAVDMLNRANARKDQASIILMTDGELATQDWLTTDNYKKTAVKEAQNNNWPIYTIELDFSGKHAGLGNVDLAKLESSDHHGTNKYSRALTTEIAYDTGACKYPLGSDGMVDTNAEPELGTWVISSEEKDASVLINKIHLAFMQILKGKITPRNSVDGDIVVDCVIPNLTCEYVLGVTAVGLESIMVKKPNESEGVLYSVSNADDPMRIIERGSQHFTVRLFCPTPGQWQITANCVKDVEATVYEDLTTDVEIALNGAFAYDDVTSALNADETAVLDKRGSIRFDAGLSYHGDKMMLDPNAGDTKAFVEVCLDDGAMTPLCTKEATICEDGFVLEECLLSTLIGSDVERIGTYAVRMRMENSRLSEGYVYSKPIKFKADDLIANFSSDDLPGIEAPVFSTCQVDLTKHLDNPDGDELIFELIQPDANGPEFLFDNGLSKVTGIPDSLSIQTGAYAGTHDLILRVTDFQTVHDYALKLTVINEPPVPTNQKIGLTLYYGEVSEGFDKTITFIGRFLPGVESWCRSKLTAGGQADYVLTLEDPDRQPLEYEVVGEGELVDGQKVCLTEHSESGLVIKPNASGNTEIEILVYDGTYVRSDDGVYVKAAFPRTLDVKVESVSNNLTEFLLLLLLAAIVILIVIAAVSLYLYFNSKIRGTWTVEIAIDGQEPMTRSSRILQGARKSNLSEVVTSAVNALKHNGDEVTKLMLDPDQEKCLEEMVDCWFKDCGKGQRSTERFSNVHNMVFSGVCRRRCAMKVKKYSNDDPKCKLRRRSGSNSRARTLTVYRGESITFVLKSPKGDMGCRITLKNR